MIHNATLTRIDASTSSPAAGRTWTQGTALSLRCCLDAPTRGQRYTLGAKIADATAVLYVEDAELGSVAPPADGDRVQVQLDSEAAAQLLQVLSVAHPTNGSLDHRQLFLKGL